MIDRDSRGSRGRPPGRFGGGGGGGRFGGRRRGPGGRGPRRRRSCYFCGNAIKVIDYKNVDLLWNYLDDREKIVGHRQSGTCAKHQRRLAVAIKRAPHGGAAAVHAGAHAHPVNGPPLPTQIERLRLSAPRRLPSLESSATVTSAVICRARCRHSRWT